MAGLYKIEMQLRLFGENMNELMKPLYESIIKTGIFLIVQASCRHTTDLLCFPVRLRS